MGAGNDSCGRITPSIGCPQCPDNALCGGLQLAAPLYNCLSFCCKDPQDCDNVCRNNPEGFAQRVREVGGYELDNVPRNAILPSPSLPPLVPLLYHGSGRKIPFHAAGVCLPLYSVIERHNGEARYSSAESLARSFALRPDVSIMLTGTASDAPLERWWSLGPQRKERIRALRRLGIALVWMASAKFLLRGCLVHRRGGGRIRVADAAGRSGGQAGAAILARRTRPGSPLAALRTLSHPLRTVWPVAESHAPGHGCGRAHSSSHNFACRPLQHPDAAINRHDGARPRYPGRYPVPRWKCRPNVRTAGCPPDDPQCEHA